MDSSQMRAACALLVETSWPCDNQVAKEDAATQTPRSTVPSLSEALDQTPRSCASEHGVKPSGSSESDVDVDQDDSQQEYLDFLHDFAGSFDGSHGSDEDSCSDGENDGTSHDVLAQQQEDEHWGEESGNVRLLENVETKVRGRAARARSFASDVEEWESAGSSSASAKEPGSAPDATALDAKPATVRHTEADVAIGMGNLRVVDGYDVVLALRHYASLRAGPPSDHLRQDVQETIRLKKEQAESLAASVKNSRAALHVRTHYARVRDALSAQVRDLEAWLQKHDRSTADTVQHVAA